MSQVQTMGGGGSPAPSVEYVQGNTGGPVGADPSYITYFIGDTTQGVEVNGNAGTFTETITMRNATAAATAGAAQKGASSYDSDFFTVTSGYVTLSNSVIDTVETVGVVVEDLITFTPPATAGTYRLIYQIAAYNETDANSGSGYQLEGTVVTDGLGTITTVGSPVIVMNGDAAVFDTSLVDVVVSGGNIILQVTGVLAKTIQWTGRLDYLFGGA